MTGSMKAGKWVVFAGLAWVLVGGSACVRGQQGVHEGAGEKGAEGAGSTALTIYNQDFAVARATVDLDLKAGANEVTTTKVTNMLEPDSVVLRDPSGKRSIQILEQNYDAALATQPWMLQRYEGQTISFEVTRGDKVEVVQGKIVRAGGADGGAEPLIEVNGKLQFQLPGLPLFPASTDGLLLKPTLRWQIEAGQAERFPAELDYITHGLGWSATYNVVVPENEGKTANEKADVVGWVTINNNSGTDFPDAKIQLMAGDVAKMVNQPVPMAGRVMMAMAKDQVQVPQVTQKAFDDFHLYDLHRLATLKDRETKQIEFMHSADVAVTRKYEFDPNAGMFYPMADGGLNLDPGFGMSSNKKVSVRLEFKNSEENHLGMPLPAGRIRFYRKDAEGQMEFVGESNIDHTPKDETVKVTTGSAFDITGERKRTDFHVDESRRELDESYAITIKNHKAQPVTVVAVEHMNRAQNWEITQKSGEYTKRDSATIEFPVSVPANGEQTVSYRVHYSW